MKYVITVICVYINDYCLGDSKSTSALHVTFGNTFFCRTKRRFGGGVCTPDGPVH